MQSETAFPPPLKTAAERLCALSEIRLWIIDTAIIAVITNPSIN
jgi:hypothetical protein